MSGYQHGPEAQPPVRCWDAHGTLSAWQTHMLVFCCARLNTCRSKWSKYDPFLPEQPLVCAWEQIGSSMLAIESVAGPMASFQPIQVGTLQLVPLRNIVADIMVAHPIRMICTSPLQPLVPE
jgi:hypothetical protein